jgi:hypothetical protein
MEATQSKPESRLFSGLKRAFLHLAANGVKHNIDTVNYVFKARVV